MSRATLRPDSGGLFELELWPPEPDEDGPSILFTVTPPAPAQQSYALNPETARQVALALLEQVDAYERWRAAQ